VLPAKKHITTMALCQKRLGTPNLEAHSGRECAKNCSGTWDMIIFQICILLWEAFNRLLYVNWMVVTWVIFTGCHNYRVLGGGGGGWALADFSATPLHLYTLYRPCVVISEVQRLCTAEQAELNAVCALVSQMLYAIPASALLRNYLRLLC
jgi:hypothetical protein